MSDIPPLDPEKMVRTLSKRKVRYVLIGALAARLQGLPRFTADADITPATDTENLENLAGALRELDARVFMEEVPEGLTFDCSAKNLQQAIMWNLITTTGRLDIVFKPSGTEGYEDLMADVRKFEAFGTTLYTASIQDIIRSKKAFDRPQDRQDIIILNAILKRGLY